MSAYLQKIVQDTFLTEFEESRFKSFIVEIFNEFHFEESDISHTLTEAEKNHIAEFVYLGSYEDESDEKIDVLTVKLQKGYKIERARHFQRNIIGKYLKNNFDANYALVAFYSDDDSTWRLSFVEIDRKFEEGKIKTEVETPAKRFSFLVGRGESTHTAQKQLFDVLEKQRDISVDLLRSAFSIEKVAKEFYIEIAKLFTKLAGGERKIGREKISESGLLKLPSGQNEQTRKEFAVRLIGRVLFCWFLKKKKSAAEVSLLSDEILSSRALAKFADGDSSDFYHKTIEPLFFEVLNTPVDDRFEDFQKDPWKQTPFLNGGLFEPLRVDFYKFNDVTGVSEFVNTLSVPNEWFRELFDLFETYNFTIDESSSIDVDLSIDPEMLGRVFENLLAEINPETGESARKSTGSYYTPRPIVEYMVDESLKQFLITATAIDEKKLDKLISFDDDENDLTKDEKRAVIDAFDKAKILDPACGSGAFPIGIMQKMMHALQKVDPDAEIWLEKMLDDVKDPAFRNMLDKKLRGDRELSDYTRKLGIIQKSIFGVDIQEIAVEISKLRCFLSLVVDDKIIESEPNRGIHALPNLEFKFVAANTLIGVPKIETGAQLFSFDDEIDNLKRAREDYFQSYAEKKSRAAEKFLEAQKKLALRIINDNNLDKETKETGNKLAGWNPFAYESSEWFDPEWMFGVKDGFDIVIGNPPYGAKYSLKQLDKIEIKELQKYFRKRYDSAKSISKVQKGSLDTYSLFIDFGLFHVNAKNTILSFIVPMSITSSESMSALHRLLYQNCSTLWFSTYFDRPKKVFDNAEQPVSIFMAINNQKSTNKLLTTKLNKRYSDTPISNIILNLSFVNAVNHTLFGRIPKIGKEIEISILDKLNRVENYLGNLISHKPTDDILYYRTAGGRYYKLFTNFSTNSTQEKKLFLNQVDSTVIGGILSSSLYWWFHHIYSDIWHVKSNDLNFFPIPRIPEKNAIQIRNLFSEYNDDLKKNSRKVKNHIEYYARKSREIIDLLDKTIHPLYDLDENESEFIINYDRKFRTDE